MLTKREKLLIRPWQMQRYENHKRKIESAQPAIDFSSPTIYPHVSLKWKKLQAEKERLDQIKKENVRLLQRLGNIMTKKRIENFWQHPRPDFLNREKIYANRPKTCSGRVETVASEESFVSTAKSKSRGRSATRCATCSGKPVKRNQVIPEERIPWEPPRKSWNVKIISNEFKGHKCCPVCCSQ
ncbi:unnamed protein product [Hermetia illucens]|uniref:Uncharacterized protein n=1 Tax=Hermetia illucens TaxID=343691 RepID=A0A7R8Z132_HERIL|nr:uncharacterized protein LOC119660284 [Hermetia illucens]CAD7093094.1 unnamed protein product [Hermetia illucens]